MDESECRDRCAAARVARLATVTAEGRPHLVPITFALADDVIYTCIDDKPKSTRHLRRLDNLAASGRACILVDHYDDDWTTLWWVRVDATAEVLDAATTRARTGLAALAAKYGQYAESPPPGPVIVLRPVRWRSWSAQPG